MPCFDLPHLLGLNSHKWMCAPMRHHVPMWRKRPKRGGGEWVGSCQAKRAGVVRLPASGNFPWQHACFPQGGYERASSCLETLTVTGDSMLAYSKSLSSYYSAPILFSPLLETGMRRCWRKLAGAFWAKLCSPPQQQVAKWNTGERCSSASSSDSIWKCGKV